MPWCPICKKEYAEGEMHCPDCDTALVDELAAEEMNVSAEAELPEDVTAKNTLAKVTAPTKVYQKPETRYEETKSSAYTFLIVGGAGAVIILLHMMGIFSLPLNDFAIAVMGVLFVIFVGVGVVSMVSAAKQAAGLASESQRVTDMENWCRKNLKAEEIDAATNTSDTPELLYFHRSEKMRSLITEAYPSIEEELADKLIEDIYPSLFENK